MRAIIELLCFIHGRNYFGFKCLSFEILTRLKCFREIEEFNDIFIKKLVHICNQLFYLDLGN